MKSMINFLWVLSKCISYQIWMQFRRNEMWATIIHTIYIYFVPCPLYPLCDWSAVLYLLYSSLCILHVIDQLFYTFCILPSVLYPPCDWSFHFIHTKYECNSEGMKCERQLYIQYTYILYPVLCILCVIDQLFFTFCVLASVSFVWLISCSIPSVF